MKKATITVTFEKEKLDALQFYISKKDVDLQKELTATMSKLYEKYVPQPTREYIEDRLEKEVRADKAQRSITKGSTAKSIDADTKVEEDTKTQIE